MVMRNRWMMMLVAALVSVAAPATVAAQDDKPAEGAEKGAEGEKKGEAAEGEAAEGEAAEGEAAEGEAAEGEAAEGEAAEGEKKEEAPAPAPEEEKKESAHGSYEFKRSYGGGLEAGFWFNDLTRLGLYSFENNGGANYDIVGPFHFDAAAEASIFQGTRFSLFGGIQTPFSSNPSATALYIGLEPAFAFRRDMWELALGMGVGLGTLSASEDTVGDLDASLIVMRPFIEVRRYLSTLVAVYGRVGFNQWIVNGPEGVQPLDTLGGIPIQDDDNLDEGGAYLALGVRFGHYPEHVKSVPDTDGDGLRDDVDTCPEEPEDFDEFEDNDGCPDLDNDQDGIPDAEDKCVMDPEDKDGWQDEDGCPESDDDLDGDGILNKDDQCVNDPEDKDGFQDEDGCPDLDNDNDNIADKDDKCPDTAGVPQKQGCPFEKVQVTLKGIVIKDKIFFEYNKATIKKESFQLLDDVASTIKAYPRIKLIEIGGHTDHAGSEKYNQDLSQRRAESVRKYLIDKGIDEGRLVAKGYGESKPKVPLPEDGKETEEGAEKNRRVEFNILEQETVTKTVREDQVDKVEGEVEEVEKVDDKVDDKAE
jgi:outer membrane protein OmpA-like peptidoglycan-associated protein